MQPNLFTVLGNRTQTSLWSDIILPTTDWYFQGIIGSSNLAMAPKIEMRIHILSHGFGFEETLQYLTESLQGCRANVLQITPHNMG